MESVGGAWPERLRPLQLPRHPPLCDRLTHLPLSLEYPPEHFICCWYDSSSQYPNTHRPWETLSLKGSSCVRGRMAAVWCIIWLVYVLECCLGPAVECSSIYLISALPGLLLVEIVLSNELRVQQTCCCSTWLLVECAVSYNYHLDPHLSCPLEWRVWQAWYYFTIEMENIWVFTAENGSHFMSQTSVALVSSPLEMTNMQTWRQDLPKHFYKMLICALF